MTPRGVVNRQVDVVEQSTPPGAALTAFTVEKSAHTDTHTKTSIIFVHSPTLILLHTHLCNCSSTAVFVALTDLAVVIIIHSLLLFVTLKVSLCRCWDSEMSLAGTSS